LKIEQKTDFRGQKTDFRGQKTDFRGQKSDFRVAKIEIRPFLHLYISEKGMRVSIPFV
jgi:hypothetical protein